MHNLSPHSRPTPKPNTPSAPSDALHKTASEDALKAVSGNDFEPRPDHQPGTATTAITVPAIRNRVLINAPIDKVFAMFASAKGWDAWFTQGTQMEPVPGSPIRFRWRNFGADKVNVDEVGKVTRCKPNQCFAFEWQPSGEFHTEVIIEFEQRNDGVLVSVTDKGHPLTEQGLKTLMDCSVGWGEALTLAKVYCETGWSIHNH